MSSAKYKVQQFLAVPLLGTSGRLLGMFGVLDRLDGDRNFAGRCPPCSRSCPIRLRSCWKRPAICICRNSTAASAEALIELAREMDGALRLPDFARRFVSPHSGTDGSRESADFSR